MNCIVKLHRTLYYCTCAHDLSDLLFAYTTKMTISVSNVEVANAVDHKGIPSLYCLLWFHVECDNVP